MKKSIIVLLCAVALLASSCGSENKPAASVTTGIEAATGTVAKSNAATSEAAESGEITTQPVGGISAATVMAAIQEAVKPKENMITLLPGDDDYEDSFDYLFDFDIRLTSDSSVCYCASGKLADEIDVFVLKDENDVSKLTTALKKRANSRSATYRGYYDSESEKAKNALILSNGKYVAFVISDDNSAGEKAFNGLF